VPLSNRPSRVTVTLRLIFARKLTVMVTDNFCKEIERNVKVTREGLLSTARMLLQSMLGYSHRSQEDALAPNAKILSNPMRRFPRVQSEDSLASNPKMPSSAMRRFPQAQCEDALAPNAKILSSPMRRCHPLIAHTSSNRIGPTGMCSA
jgi:hypothetical protein